MPLFGLGSFPALTHRLAVALGALGAGAVAVIAVATGLFSTTDVTEFTAEQQQLIAEHVYGGLPGTANLHVRNGYVLSYNPETRTPNWVAYHVEPDYRNTPQRGGNWYTFRQDPDIDNEAKDAEYVGLPASRGYVRGHLTPYGVMGGDRDGDGQYAEDDDDDRLTVYRIEKVIYESRPNHHVTANLYIPIWSAGGQMISRRGLWGSAVDEKVRDLMEILSGNRARC